MFLKKVRLVPYANYRMGQAARCWRTADGGTYCDDRKYYLPG